METVDSILRRNEANTYTMGCYASNNDLYNQMREDIKVLCAYLEAHLYSKRVLEDEIKRIESKIVGYRNRNDFEAIEFYESKIRWFKSALNLMELNANHKIKEGLTQ